MISLRDIKLSKGKKPILEIKSFDLPKKKTTAVIGPNGAGKSTLLKVLALLEKPDIGSIYFRDRLATSRNNLALRRRMSVVFQEPLLLNTTVFNNVAQGLMLRGAARREIVDRVEYWLERLGIAGLRNRKPYNLSGGEAQRVSLARAFVLEPEVIFLDEPFSALDFPSKINLLEELGQLLDKTGATAFFVTHDFNEIPYLTEEVIVIDGGTIVFNGKLKDLVEGRIGIRAVGQLLEPFMKANKMNLRYFANYS